MRTRLADPGRIASPPAGAVAGCGAGLCHGLESLLGRQAWRRLPVRVRERFGDPARVVDYHGVFEEVRANRTGRVLAWVCRLIGSPVAPRTGRGIPAVVHVVPTRGGVRWQRDYCWANRRCSRVSSTKVIEADGVLVEKLPAGLCMPLDVFERVGVLHFVSRGYYFELRLGRHLVLRLPLPEWLSPGVTHVEHTDEADGWFRFTMTVTHTRLGELFFQTGRFRAAGGPHDADL